jgi:zinc finger CCHC domain-containing protein 8
LFDPGEVRGALLREALGLDTGEEGDACWGDGQWLSNMAIWGYPRGWTGERDPRYEVVRRIEGESDEDEEDDDDVFLIFGDAGEEEEITLPTAASHLPHTVPANNPPTTDEDLLSPPPQPTPPIPPPPPPAPAPPKKPHRWASYPTTHFSSALLPIYTGYALPPLPPLSPNPIPNTTAQQALWDNTTPPPPPLTSPPPLPPPPDVIPIVQNEFDELDDGEAEMDLSDSD